MKEIKNLIRKVQDQDSRNVRGRTNQLKQILERIDNNIEEVDRKIEPPIVVTDIETLTPDQCNNLKVGNIVNKVTDTEKHTYIVNYKDDIKGEMLLTYADWQNIEGVYYDKTGGDWAYVQTDNTHISTIEISGNIATDKNSDTKVPSTKAAYNEIHPAVPTEIPAGGFLPNVLYTLGVLSTNTTFALATPADATIVNHYYFVFDTTSEIEVVWPSGVKWFGSVPSTTLEANKHYEVSIVNGIGVLVATELEGFEYCETVDIGLSVKWATKNVGAATESDYGDYYAWGELETKDDYSLETYTYEDSPTVLPEDRDVATKTYGPNFRMPTKEEFNELLATKSDTTNYSWTWKEVGGHNGYEIEYLVNHNKIFLPAAGSWSDTSLYGDGETGCYWASSLDTGETTSAWYLELESSYVYCDSLNRINGYSVRPVEVISQ